MAEDDDKVSFGEARKRTRENGPNQGSSSQESGNIIKDIEKLSRGSGYITIIKHIFSKGSLKWKLAIVLALLNDILDPVESFASLFTSGLGQAVGFAIDLGTSAILLPIIGEKRSFKALKDYVPILDILPFYTMEVCNAYLESRGINLDSGEETGSGGQRSPRQNRRRRRAPPKRRSSWGRSSAPYYILGGVSVVVIVFAMFSGYFPIYGAELARSETGRSVRDFASDPFSVFSGLGATIANASAQGAEELQKGFQARPACQRSAIRKNIPSEKTQAYIESCVCKELGKKDCPDWRDEKDEAPDISVSADNYLEVDVQTNVQDNLGLRDVCGERCGKVDVTLTNNGGKDIRIEELYLELRDGSDRYPIKVNKQGGSGQPTLTYRLSSFTERATSPTSWTSLDQQDIVLSEPGETKTVTFLANLETREGCIDQLEDGEEDRGATGECDERRDLFATLSVTPEVTVEYSSTTSNSLNVQVLGFNEWNQRDNDGKEAYISENCRKTEDGPRQTSSELVDAVSLLMYTPCQTFYYPNKENLNKQRVMVTARGDDSRIDSFTLNSLSGTRDMCDYQGETDLSDEGHPKALTEVGSVACENGECKSPIASCYKGIPPNAGTLNLVLEAGYTARLEKSGQFEVE